MKHFRLRRMSGQWGCGGLFVFGTVGEDGCAGLWWLVGRLVAIWRLVRSSETGAVEESLLTIDREEDFDRVCDNFQWFQTFA